VDPASGLGRPWQAFAGLACVTGGGRVRIGNSLGEMW